MIPIFEKYYSILRDILKYKTPWISIYFGRRYYLHERVLSVFGAASIFSVICFCLACFSFVLFVVPHFSSPSRGFAPRLLLLCIVFSAFPLYAGFATTLFPINISTFYLPTCVRISASICACVLPPCLLDGLRPNLFSHALTPHLV